MRAYEHFPDPPKSFHEIAYALNASLFPAVRTVGLGIQATISVSLELRSYAVESLTGPISFVCSKHMPAGLWWV